MTSAEQSKGSRWFWWAMGLVSTVIGGVAIAVILAVLGFTASSRTGNGSPFSPPLTPAPSFASASPNSSATNIDSESPSLPPSGIGASAEVRTGVYRGTSRGAYNSDFTLRINTVGSAATGWISWDAVGGTLELSGFTSAMNAELSGQFKSAYQTWTWELTLTCTAFSDDRIDCQYSFHPVGAGPLPEVGTLTGFRQ